MIKTIKGTLTFKYPPNVVIECNGIGYEVALDMNSFTTLPELGNQVFLWTYHRITEDRHSLYGFPNKEKLELFLEVIKVNKIGPQIALAILSTLSISEFIQAINEETPKSLVRVPGIGQKTAERLIVEMKDRIKKLNIASISSDKQINNDEFDKAIAGLTYLGLNEKEAITSIKQVYVEGMPVVEIINKVLSQRKK